MAGAQAEAAQRPGLNVMFSPEYATRSFAIAGATILAAVNVLIASTILPSVVRDIGGQNLYAWNTTLYVVASIVGASLSPRMLVARGARPAYRIAILVFFLGALICTLAPAMPVLLIGRTVQGFGGGFMAALTYAVIRQAFPEPLWPRAFAITNAMWGIATVAGPTIGGIFSNLGEWRLAFATVLPIAAILLVLFERSLRNVERTEMTVRPFPRVQLILLAGSVLAVSAGSVSSSAWSNLAGIAVAVALLVALVRRERRSAHPMMPTGTFSFASPIGSVLATMVLLGMGVSAEIFSPFFLQRLHGLSPLAAGYLVSLLSVGWTAAALVSAGLIGKVRRRAMVGGPLMLFVGLVILTIAMPQQTTATASLVASGVGFLCVGVGIGTTFSHLLARVLSWARPDEQAGAASAMSMVQLVATAFGAALGGVITNLCHYADVAGGGTVTAATWYYGLFALLPLTGAFFALRVVRFMAVHASANAVP